MRSIATSRRALLAQAALGAGALAAAGLARPVLAGAQAPEDEDLRDFLVEAISLEQLAALAYETAANGGTSEMRSTFERFRDQEQAHANALRSALDSLGFDAPDPPDSPTDTGAFEDVDGLEAEASRRLLTLLGELADLNSPRDHHRYLAKLESQQISYYTAQAPAVVSVDLTTTSAEIAGCQAQHLVVLRGALGDSGEQAAADAARVGADAIPGGSGE